MRRREFITLLGGAATWPLAARGQQAALPVIGFLNSASADGYAPMASAFRQGLPTIYEWPEFVRAGGLVTYCVDRNEAWLQLGIYVSRILNGAKPAELPVIQPTKFELVFNLKTAKALGLKIDESLLRFADEVIE